MPPRTLLTLLTLSLLALTAASGCVDRAGPGYAPAEGDYLLFDVSVSDSLSSVNGTYRVEVTHVSPDTYTVQGTPSEEVEPYLATELEIKPIEEPLAPGADTANMTRVGPARALGTDAVHYRTTDGTGSLDVYLDTDTELLLLLEARDPAAGSALTIRLNDTNVPGVLD